MHSRDCESAYPESRITNPRVRLLRLEFAGALYHVTARGDRREPIYEDDADRQAFLDVLAVVTDRFNWLVHAYCEMTNRYHRLVETPDGNLSSGMRQLNGVYAQCSSSAGRVGPLFEGRYKAVIVQNESYLLEVARYIVLNPVRADGAQCRRLAVEQLPCDSRTGGCAVFCNNRVDSVGFG